MALAREAREPLWLVFIVNLDPEVLFHLRLKDKPIFESRWAVCAMETFALLHLFIDWVVYVDSLKSESSKKSVHAIHPDRCSI